MIKKMYVALSLALFMTIFLLGGSDVSASTSGKAGERREPLYAATVNNVQFSQNYGGSQLVTIQDAVMRQVSYGSISNAHVTLASTKVQIVDQAALSIAGPTQVNLANPIVLNGYLRDLYSGAGIANKTITFSIGGVFIDQTHTDDQGLFTASISNNLPAGKFMITANFKGAHLIEPASATIWVEILPATIRIQTVPAIPGITFKLYGQQFTSGADGMATVQIGAAGQFRLDVALDQLNNPSLQVDFGRWTDEVYQPYRVITVPDDNIIQVGLNIYHKVTLKFIDLDGLVVDPGRISSINIRSVQGDVFALNPTDTPWLPASRTARRQSGLVETDLLYSVNSVMIDGSNVVNSAQQRFYAKTDDTWTITLLLYSLNISARDGLFASPVGKSIDLIFPNGHIKNYPLDATGNLKIHALARGIYHISLLGVKGMGTTTPVALSRNQVVKVNIVTKMDVMVASAVALGFAAGLVIIGRPRLVTNIFRRKRGSSPDVAEM